MTEADAKKVYQKRGKPISPVAAKKLIAETKRPSPFGGTLEALPPVHVALFLELASADTVQK